MSQGLRALTGDITTFTWHSHSPEETFSFGEAIGRCTLGGLVVALNGPLGAGKTQLVKGLAAANATGAAPEVTSPTFTLVHEYPGRVALHHVDAYRLSGSRDLISLGFEEMIRDDSCVVIEWADRVDDAIPEDTLSVRLAHDPPTGRDITITAGGERSRRVLIELEAARR